MDYYKRALEVHEKNKGKLAITGKVPLKNKDDLSIAYTPGVAAPCLEISKNREDVYKYTGKGNTVAIITDGSAVLGLGDIGPEAALPVMEGKALLFKAFADIDAVPVCIKTRDAKEIVSIIEGISPTYGGINLEDISAPRCFQIEDQLKERLDIPVFHDDQHGTAIVTCAAAINALKITGKSFDNIKIVINGAGAAGSAILKMLLQMGANNIIVCDRSGIISMDRADNLSEEKKEIARLTNPDKQRGGLAEAMKSADMFIGVSSPKTVTEQMVRSMNSGSIIFAMANPEPEILPDMAIAAGARIVGTGRSDYTNQINNVLAFPGVFKGALAARARQITEPMKVAAAVAIAESVAENQLCENHIIPSVFQEGVADGVASAVADAWRREV